MFFMKIYSSSNSFVCQLIGSSPISGFEQLITNPLMIVAVFADVVQINCHYDLSFNRDTINAHRIYGVTSARLTPCGRVIPFQIAFA